MDFEEKLRQQKEERAKQAAAAKAQRLAAASKRNASVLEKTAQNEREKRERQVRERELEAQKHAEIRANINKDALVKRELALHAYHEKRRLQELERRKHIKQKLLGTVGITRSDSKSKLPTVSPSSSPSTSAATPSAAAPSRPAPVPAPKRAAPIPAPAPAPVAPPTPVEEPKPSAPSEPAPAPAPAPAPFKAKRPAPPTSSPFAKGPGSIAITQIDRSSKDLKEIDGEILNATGLLKLGLARNKIATVPGNFSSTLTALESLDLAYNGFRGDAFADSNADATKGLFGFNKLKELSLCGNRITSLPNFASAFPPLVQSLTILDLGNNRLEAIPDSVFDLTALEKLSLNHNRLSQLPSRIASLSNLKYLHLAENKLSALPREIGDLNKLTTLLLADNSLQQLPNEIGLLGALTDLDLAKNQLTSLPETLGSLVLLQKLNLGSNALEALPEAIFGDGGEASGLLELHTLILKRNKISELTSGFYRLSGLKKLDLTSNQLTSLSSEISNFYQLRELLLADNRLTAIPDEYGYIECLETINLARNELTYLPPSNYFVVNFYLGYNDLEALPDMTGMEYIQELYISGNKRLGHLPDYVFTLNSLVKLYANNIGLTQLPSEIQSLSNLEVLDIANNALTSLPEELSGASQLRALDVSNNQLSTLPDSLGNLWEIQVLDASHNQLSSVPKCFASLAERGAELVYHSNPTSSEAVGGRPQLAFNKISKPIGAADMIGRRPTMEDAFLIEPNFHGVSGADLIGVFDGHAGRAAADFAADKFAEVLRTKLTLDQINGGAAADGAIASALTAALKGVNDLFREHIKTAQSSIKFTGTTGLVALLTPSKRIHIANIGDTRAIIARDYYEGIRVSRDHKPCDEDEEDRISALGGFVVISSSGGPARVNGSLAVSRGIGDFHMTPFVSDEPYIWHGDITSSDSHLILACDGLWDEVTDDEAVEELRNGDAPLGACVRLRDLAYLRGSDDNISVIVVKF